MIKVKDPVSGACESGSDVEAAGSEVVLKQMRYKENTGADLS